MRLSQTPSSLLSLLLAVLSQSGVARAGPIPKDNLHELEYSLEYLEEREDCVSRCGSTSQFCCHQGETCTTLAGNIATCLAGGSNFVQTVYGAGGYAVYTTTYTETDLITSLRTRTSTYSVYWAPPTTTSVYVAPAPAPTASAICTSSLGEKSCGIYCCASDQRCAGPNTCTYYAAMGTATGSSPARVTSGSGSTVTFVVSATATLGFIPAATASGTTFPITQGSKNGGLSGGAIAGIVIGVLAGILLLLLFCFCCIIKTGIDGLLAIFGLGKKKRRSTERVEVIEERYSRHGSRHGSGTASRRNTHSGWFGGGGRPSRVTETRKKKSSGLGGLGLVGAGLLGLAAILGLKRKHDRNEKPPRSDVSSSYYSYTDTSASSASSDRTRRTRDTRGTRPSRR